MAESPSILKTPGSTSAPRTPKFSRRRSLFPHLEALNTSPQRVSLSPSSFNSRSSKRKEIAPKFKQQMPRRNVEVEEKDENKKTTSPITTKSFYGGAPSYVPRFMRNNDDVENLDKNFNSKISLKTPPKQQRKIKKYLTKSVPASKKYGINRGVSHNIKKPKAPKPVKEKKSPKSSSSDDETSKTQKTPKSKLISLTNKKTPKSTVGNLMMNESTSVGYEIKNGEMVFKLQRPLRKSPYFNKAPLTPSNTPKTPKRLFDPSSKRDMVNDWQPSPPKSSRRNKLPSPVKQSPVKFDPIEDNEESQDITNIVANLQFNDEDTASAVTVTDDELARIAAESTQQLQNIIQEPIFNVQDDIHQILSNIQVTEEERQENRNTMSMQLVLDDDSNDAIVDEPIKLAPVFDMTKTNANQAKSRSALTKVKAKPSLKVHADQMIIDAGQKLIDPIACQECTHVYNPGQPEDEEAHQKVHDFYKGIIPFKGWKKYDIIKSKDIPFGDELIKVTKDHQNLFDKVENEFLKVVDNDLGIQEGSSRVQNREETKFFMYVTEGRVVGILMSELLDDKHKISRAERNPKEPTEWLLHEILSAKKGMVGVSRIWVAQDFRRQGIAKKLTTAMKSGFYGSVKIIKNGDFAFSHTTPSGSEFASNFVGGEGKFLTYSTKNMTL